MEAEVGATVDGKLDNADDNYCGSDCRRCRGCLGGFGPSVSHLSCIL